MSRPRPRVPGKPNPSMMGYQQQTPPQEANSRQTVPSQLSSMEHRALAARGMLKKQMYKKGNSSRLDPCTGRDTGQENDNS